MYEKHGRIDDASKFFQRNERKKDLASWTAMIAGYAENGTCFS